MLKKLFSNPQLKTYLLAVLIILLAVGTLASTFKYLKFSSKSDEAVYLNYAQYIKDYGAGGFKQLFKFYLGDSGLWVYPSPLRILYILFCAGWLTLWGAWALNLAYFSLFCFFIFLLLNFYYLRLYFGNRLAILALALLSFSPLNFAMARRALSESCLALFISWAVWLFYGLLKKFNKSGAVGFIVVFSAAILIKETAVLWLFFFLAWHLWQAYQEKIKFSRQEFLLIYITPCLVVGGIYAILGVLFYVPQVAQIVIASPVTNDYAILLGNGPWYRYLIDYLVLSPWVFILGLGYIAVNLFARQKDKLTVFFCAYLIFNLVAFNFFTKNVRYVMGADLALRIFALLMLDKLTQQYAKNKDAILFVLMASLVFYDFLNFLSLFMLRSVYDPTSYHLLHAVGMVPGYR